MELPPIRQCKRVGCEEMFFLTRSDREFCSNNCAAKQWYKDVTTGGRRPARVKNAEATTPRE